MGWWKQLFCEHIYKFDKEEYLRKDRLHTGTMLPTYNNYKIYAKHYTCIKCDKKTIEEKRILLL